MEDERKGAWKTLVVINKKPYTIAKKGGN